MPVIRPSVNTDLQSYIGRAETMHGFIQKTIPDAFNADSDETILVAGFFSLVMEHHGAILYLLRAGQFDGSAFALVRPLIDGAYRAHWIYTCAKPKIIARIGAGEDVYPPLPNMAAEIEKRIDSGGFFPLIVPLINTLHGFTHGGLEQLARRFDESGNIRPSYSEAEKIEVIDSTTGHLTALSIAWCQLVSKEQANVEARSKAISDSYNELYGTTAT
jgi:hypothetical protein